MEVKLLVLLRIFDRQTDKIGKFHFQQDELYSSEGKCNIIEFLESKKSFGDLRQYDVDNFGQ